jgi:hypothetical protein
MLSAVRATWNGLCRGKPGCRFRALYVAGRLRNRGRPRSGRAVRLGSGVTLIATGLAIGWLPGPGGFLAILGAALLCAESGPLATTLDRGEIGLWKAWGPAWKHRALSARSIVVLGTASAAVVTAYAAVLILFD